MVWLNWGLFGEDFPEEIGLEQPGNRPEQQIEKDEEYYELSDAIREVYYVTTLREIYNPEYSNHRPELLEGLNSFDEALGQFMDDWKAELRDLEATHAEMEPHGPEELREAAVRVVEDVRSVLQKNRAETGPLRPQLQEQLQQVERLVPDWQWEQFRQYSENLLVCVQEYEMSSQEELQRVRSRVYAQLRRLPQHLGSPYSQRYDMYQQLVSYRSFSGAARSPAVAMMLLDDGRFEAYYTGRIEALADQVSQTQVQMCSGSVSVDTFDQHTQELQAIMNTYSIVRKKYLGSGNKHGGQGCFGLMDVYDNNGNMMRYAAFSGVFDSSDPNIQKVWSWPAMVQDFQRIVVAYEAQTGIPVIRARTNQEERYYSSLGHWISLKQTLVQLDRDFNEIKRMFSCCEAKYLTCLDKDPTKVKRYELYIRLKPCVLCSCAIDSFTANGYPAPVMGGGMQPCGNLPQKPDFDALAAEIASGKKHIIYPPAAGGGKTP